MEMELNGIMPFIANFSIRERNSISSEKYEDLMAEKTKLMKSHRIP